MGDEFIDRSRFNTAARYEFAVDHVQHRRELRMRVDRC